MSRKLCNWTVAANFGPLLKTIALFKTMVSHVFWKHSENGLFWLKIDLLDHLTTDLSRFEGLTILDSLSFERCNVHIKQVYRQTSFSLSTNLTDTVRVMNTEHYYCTANGSGIAMQQRRTLWKRSAWKKLDAMVSIKKGKVFYRYFNVGSAGPSLISPVVNMAARLFALLQWDTLESFSLLLSEVVWERLEEDVASDVQISVRKSEYVVGGSQLTMKNVPKGERYIHVYWLFHGRDVKLPQLVFESDVSWCERKRKKSFVLVRAGDYDEENWLCASKALLRFWYDVMKNNAKTA